MCRMAKLGSIFIDVNSGFLKQKVDCGTSLDARGSSRRKKNDRHRNLHHPLLETKAVSARTVLSEIFKSNRNSNSIWKILNCCLPKKNAPLIAVENPLLLAN